MARGSSADERRWFSHQVLEDGSLVLRWKDLFEFVVSPDGRRIDGQPLTRARPESFETHLLSQVLSTAMLRLGIEPLHATVLETQVGAVGVMGDSGYGKSSLAAALLARGSRLVTDDLMVVDIDDRLRVHPGPRRLKLLPSGARRLLGSDAVGVPVNDRTAKMVIPLGTEQVVAEPVPLVALFALGHPARGSSVSRVTIRRMTQRAAFIELTQNSFNSIVVDHPRLRVQFSTASDVASRVPMFRLSYPPGLGKLGVVHDALLETVASDGRV